MGNGGISLEIPQLLWIKDSSPHLLSMREFLFNPPTLLLLPTIQIIAIPPGLKLREAAVMRSFLAKSPQLGGHIASNPPVRNTEILTVFGR